ncbi:MAG: VWA domain-containing protein [Pirellulales bacterium]|nr:VWA domain-containing protein [Thermoguttaceae bacterium]MDD4785553.1 VWA domain-containing protein [Pirellulales bacterium]MDI9446405.1 vWA domain-containing protein [Planctomycetota bacterium]NLZ00770.1 hypothetical protein [Pirellulaceae bacterium]
MAAKDWRGASDRGGWRERAGAGKAAPRAEGGWSARRDRNHERAEQRYRLRLAAGVLTILALIAGFIAYLVFIPVRTPLLVMAATDYRPPVPPNGWVQEDLAKLATLDRKETVKFITIPWQSSQQGLRELQMRLDATRPGGPGKDVVMLYLSMHGLVNGEGEPCLLPPGASPLDSTTWLPLRSLLDSLFLQDRPGKPKDSTKKLLILDCTRLDCEWRIGLLAGGFAERLPRIVESMAIPNLLVLSASGPGQVAHAAPALRGSAFAHFLWQGLDGAADKEKSGNSDGRVTLQELHSYLDAQVGQWAIENRFDSQHPMLLPEAADWPLVYARKRTRLDLPAGGVDEDPRWAEIAELWLKHEALAAGESRPSDPLAWEEFQQGLLRLEQLVLSGEAYQADYRETLRRANALADSLAHDALPDDLAAYSLPLARRLRPDPEGDRQRGHIAADLAAGKAPESPPGAPSPPAGPPPSDPARLKPAPAAATAPNTADGKPQGPSAAPDDEQAGKTAPPPKPDTPPESQPETDPSPKPDTAPESKPEAAPASKPTPAPVPPPEVAPPQPKGPYPYLTVAEAGWKSLLTRPDPARIPAILALADNARRSLRADVVELHFLRLLEANLDWDAAAGHFPMALVANGLAEEAAAPADCRAVFWTGGLIDQADASRRIANDHLFIGSPESLAEAKRLWQEAIGDGAGKGYESAVARAEQVAEAYRLRDRAWRRAPYLAEWLFIRNYEGEVASPSDLCDLLLSLRQFAGLLEDGLEQGRWSDELSRAQTAVNSALGRLEKALADDCYQLRTSAGEDKKTLRSAELAFRVPLVTGQQRNLLREKHLRILASRAAVEAARAAAPGDVSSPAAEAAKGGRPLDMIDRLARWPLHPALFLLDRSPLGDGDADKPAAARELTLLDEKAAEKTGRDRQTVLADLARQGEAVRRLLAATREDVKRWSDQSDRLLTSSEREAGPAARLRAGYSKAERLIGGSAPLLAARLWPREEDSPAGRLRRLDLCLLLQWHGRRATDDFWGPAPGAKTPFFQIAAVHYLESARRLLPGSGALQGEPLSANELLAPRVAAAERGARIDAPDLTLIEEDAFLPHASTVIAPSQFPQGVAAWRLEAAGGRPIDVRTSQGAIRRRLAAPIGGSAAPLEYLVPNDERLQSVTQCRAEAFFRGHLVDRPIAVIHPEASVEVVHVRPVYPRPTVTVHGESRDPGYSVFVFDCSWSMSAHVGGDEANPRRIDMARSALLEILLRLAKSKNPHRVGLRIYGHRAGWNPRNQEEIITRPPGLEIHPSADVELALRPGRFTEGELEAVRNRLDDLQPTGETPLYLSIIQAIGDLRAGPEASQRHIVVITDGFNQQSSGGPAGTRKYRKDVEDELNLAGNQNIQLDIIGFDMAAENPAGERSLADLKELAQRTGGAFYPANDPSGLVAALEQSLQLSRFVVIPAGAAGQTSAEPIDLERTWEVDHPPGRRLPYIVRLDAPGRVAETAVELAGGEAIELFLRGDPRGGPPRLVHQRYGKSLRGFFDPAVDPQDPDQAFYIAAHLPEWRGTAVHFPVSIQNSRAEAFSPRPAEAWIQIAPLDSRDAASFPEYAFYDLLFEPDRPVPVLSCTALNWPLDARAAGLHVWVKFAESPPDRVIRVGDMPRGDRLPIENLAVSLEADIRQDDRQGPARLVLVERHPPGGNVHALKIAMDPPPERSRHRFSRDVGIVRHTFEYEKAPPEEIRNYKIAITRRETIIAGAVTIGEPLKIDIPRAAISGPR